jgi:hypothetical protein
VVGWKMTTNDEERVPQTVEWPADDRGQEIGQLRGAVARDQEIQRAFDEAWQALRHDEAALVELARETGISVEALRRLKQCPVRVEVARSGFIDADLALIVISAFLAGYLSEPMKELYRLNRRQARRIVAHLRRRLRLPDDALGQVELEQEEDSDTGTRSAGDGRRDR